jgi:hypothetical protein
MIEVYFIFSNFIIFILDLFIVQLYNISRMIIMRNDKNINDYSCKPFFFNYFLSSYFAFIGTFIIYTSNHFSFH